MIYIKRCIKEIKIIKYFKYVPKVEVELKKNIYYKFTHIINNQDLKNSLDDYEIKYINYIQKNGGL